MLASLEQRLEKGELIVFPESPFDLPSKADLYILRHYKLRSWKYKNISYNPINHRVTGYNPISKQLDHQLQMILDQFSQSAQNYVRKALPRYGNGWTADRASFRSEEEATRCLRHTARNDLLHIDAFTNRPSNQRRILRIYVNINPDEPRIWVTSDLLAQVLQRHKVPLGFPGILDAPGAEISLGNRFFNWFWPSPYQRSPYDQFLLRVHNFLKTCDDFQERSPRRLWSFPPGSMWMLYSDALTHAELRGQYALEHSFFVHPDVLVLPEFSPAFQFGFRKIQKWKLAS